MAHSLLIAYPIKQPGPELYKETVNDLHAGSSSNMKRYFRILSSHAKRTKSLTAHHLFSYY